MPIALYAADPSFENGGQGWTWKSGDSGWHSYTVSSERAHTGRHSAKVSLESRPFTGRAQIWGAVQSYDVSEIPRKLGVWYRIENWKQAVEKQYAQIVVMIHADRLKKLTTQPQMQIRYLLAGVSKPPYPDPVNGRYLLVGSKTPKQGRWIHFETDPVQDFIKTWGWFPANFKKMEIFLEVRYDEPLPEGASISGDVYWDDLTVSTTPAKD
jgi:hypothetical protein